MAQSPAKHRTLKGVAVAFMIWMVFSRPEIWDYWKGISIAFLLTGLAFAFAIFLSGQYKQDGKQNHKQEND